MFLTYLTLATVSRLIRASIFCILPIFYLLISYFKIFYPNINSIYFLSFLLIYLLIPISIYLASLLLEKRFLLISKERQAFGSLALVLSLLGLIYITESDFVISFIDSIINIYLDLTLAKLFTFLFQVLNKSFILIASTTVLFYLLHFLLKFLLVLAARFIGVKSYLKVELFEIVCVVFFISIFLDYFSKTFISFLTL